MPLNIICPVLLCILTIPLRSICGQQGTARFAIRQSCMHCRVLYALSGLVGKAMNPWSSPAWSTMANQGEKSPSGNSPSVFGSIDRNLSYCVNRVLTTWLMQRVWLTILDVVISDGDASLSIADCHDDQAQVEFTVAVWTFMFMSGHTQTSQLQLN